MEIHSNVSVKLGILILQVIKNALNVIHNVKHVLEALSMNVNLAMKSNLELYMNQIIVAIVYLIILILERIYVLYVILLVIIVLAHMIIIA